MSDKEIYTPKQQSNRPPVVSDADLLALREAGMTNAEIAGKMNLSRVRVYQRIGAQPKGSHARHGKQRSYRITGTLVLAAVGEIRADDDDAAQASARRLFQHATEAVEATGLRVRESITVETVAVS